MLILYKKLWVSGKFLYHNDLGASYSGQPLVLPHRHRVSFHQVKKRWLSLCGGVSLHVLLGFRHRGSRFSSYPKRERMIRQKPFQEPMSRALPHPFIAIILFSHDQGHRRQWAKVSLAFSPSFEMAVDGEGGDQF